MKKSSVDYFLYILKCFYQNTDCTKPYEEIDISEIYKLSKMHDVQGIIFTKIKDLNYFKNSEYYNRFRQKFFALARLGIILENNLNKFTEILNENKIPHVLFKGAIIRNTYPSKELRTMGDIDVYINDEYTDKALDVLQRNGFILDNSCFESYVNTVKYNGTSYEIHSSIASRNCHIHTADFIDFFKSCENHCVLISDYTYTFEPTYHIVFLLYHLLKHFVRKGCGIRMFLDFPMFIDYYADEINYSLLKKYLDELRLYDFANVVFNFCRIKFGMKLPEIFSANVENYVIDSLTNKIIVAGTFGHEIEETNHQKIQRVQIKGKYGRFSKLRSILRLVFPTKEELYYTGYWDINSSKLLIPLGHIKRFNKQLFKKKTVGKFVREMVTYKVNDSDVELISKMGIDR
ncbi:MAG: nucleotidyltransferase family protein [Ruminococcus sp.]|nr:nucleotidyltransferase family protein [Ruminococcus sp.]